MVQVNPGANDGPQRPPSEEEEKESRQWEPEPTKERGRDHTDKE
jgi:hypothetical protein